MEKLIFRRNALRKALATLKKSLDKLDQKQFDDYEELRDSIIQRFEYSVDTFWKYLKDYLRVILSIEVELARPKIVLKECFDAKIISDRHLAICIDMIEDRNLTSHGYNEKTAEKISHRIPVYFSLMNDTVEKLKIP